MKAILAVLLSILSLPSGFTGLYAAEVQVAVCSNFVAPLVEITAAFAQETGHQIIISTGSTGRHFAQISAGAPFDVFLAADEERPRLLAEKGLAVPGSRFTYALGRLVFYGEFYDANDQNVLKSLDFTHLAIANPRLAPYGRAARQALERLDLWDKLADKLVRGQNVGQTWQFIVSGNAELGVVSLAQLRAHELAGNTLQTVMIVPDYLYDPIQQQAVLLTRAAANAAATDFLEFLASPTAAAIIQKFGYHLPDEDPE